MRQGRFLPLVLLLCSSAALQAQAPAALTKGRTSIAFAFPEGGGGGFGIWKMVSDRTNLGLNVDLNIRSHDDSQSSSTQVSLAVSPAFKRYFAPGSAVAPFWRAGPSLFYQRISSDNAGVELERDQFSFGAHAGVGVDWFPFDQVSLGGFTGVRGLFVDREDDGTNWELGTMTSALTLQIYF